MTKKCNVCGEEKACSEFRAATGGYGDGLRGKCIACTNIAAKMRYAANSERIKAAQNAARKANPEKHRAADRERAKNPARKAAIKAAIKRLYAREPGYHTAYTNKRYHKDPQKHTAYIAKRRAEKLQATPAWANDFFMEEAYRLATLRTKMFGFVWHVDHIVPLRSKLVSGLHVETNIQVIPARANIQKGNKYWPDMPGSL